MTTELQSSSSFESPFEDFQNLGIFKLPVKLGLVLLTF